MVRRDSPDYEPGFAAMYSEIEGEIIDWSNRGDKTAGYLTRKILVIVNKHMNKNV